MSRPIRVPTIPGSAEWRALRRTGVGASDLPIIVGDSPFSDPVTLFQEKLGYTADPIENASMEAGHWLEDLIARWYAETEHRKVRRVNALLRKREEPWMIATPDREVAGKRLLEVKVTDHPGAEWGTPGTDQVPDRVIEQVQWQAEVADVDVVDVAVFFTRTRRREVYTVGRDPAIVSELVAYGAEFWRCVQERTPPVPRGVGLRTLLRADEIEADAELTAYVRRYLAAKADIEAMEAERDAAKALIADRLDAVGGARGDDFRIHYRPRADSAVVAWQKVAAAYRDEIESKFETGEGIPREVTERLDRVVAELTSVRSGGRPLLINPVRAEQSAA